MAWLQASFVVSDTVVFRLQDRIYPRSSCSWPKLCSFRRPRRPSSPIRLPPLLRPAPQTPREFLHVEDLLLFGDSIKGRQCECNSKKQSKKGPEGAVMRPPG